MWLRMLVSRGVQSITTQGSGEPTEDVFSSCGCPPAGASCAGVSKTEAETKDASEKKAHRQEGKVVALWKLPATPASCVL